MNKHEIYLESQKRMLKLKRGDKVTNICTSEDNPLHHCYFVEYLVRPYKNKYGIQMCDHFAKCRKYDAINTKYNTANFGINVIYKGHLSQEECDKLFNPVWEAEYGKRRPK